MIIYQVLPRLWGNGKFSDWQVPSFDYVKTLGADAIWFTGIPRHSTGKSWVKGNCGSPYSIAFCYDVNPYLADNPSHRRKEFRELVKRTHAAGLKVITDFVPNHVAPGCRDVPTHDWFDFDWSDTRKIDYSSPGAWRDMLDVALYWAGTGVDGLRCDMIEMVPPEFLAWLTAKVRERFPSFIFIGEVYQKDKYLLYINEVGFDLLYDKSGFYDSIRGVITSGESATTLTRNWQELGDIQGRMLNFLENHDEQRLASPYFAGSPARGYAALAAGALFGPASFMIYSGQELGEDAAEGAEGRTSIFDIVKVRTLQDIWKVVTGGRKLLNSEETGVLARYRAIMHSAVAFRGLSNWDLCYCQPQDSGFDRNRHFAFVRYDSGSAWLVFCNFSDSEALVRITFPSELRSLHSMPQTHPVAAAPWDAAVVRIPGH